MGLRGLLLVLLLGLALAWDSTSDSVLNVHVVPHSHNDPGWWKTFEGYYQDWTKGILSSVVEILNEEKSRKFIWAEISYFQRWWDDQSAGTRDTVKKLVENRQLEFVTAGWVMNDEANTHMVDIVNQLTEGHEWLERTLHTKPRFGWAIDPFGHSPTMPYVLEKMQIEGIVINRAHKQIKQTFRDSKHLEFHWTGENLNSSSSFKMLTHMLPWKLYDIPNTCGPDWYVCEKFDFERPEAIPITDDNVKERSETLVRMYKEKASLFRHNSVLVPLGDDFKYKNPDITRKMFTQYEKLFKYINSNEELRVNIQFSTLSQYFTEIKNYQPLTESYKETDKKDEWLPSYQGDFFTYCDENEDYWSGYFTTRPYMKGLTRSTQAILRTGEILASIARARGSVNKDKWQSWFNSIETARRNVALFQHHDGVTGTARRAVVQDYADRLLSSLAKVAEQSSDMALVVLSNQPIDIQAKEPATKLSWTTEPANRPSQPGARVLEISKEAAVVVVFNPLAHSRAEVVSVQVNTNKVVVLNSRGETTAAQVDPLWEIGATSPSSNKFVLHFVANIQGIGLETYFIHSDSDSDSQQAVLSSVVEYTKDTVSGGQIMDGWNYDSKSLAESNDLVVENSEYRVHFSGHGKIVKVDRLGGTDTRTVSIDQGFLSYNTFNGGAYLFLPRGPAQPLRATTKAVRVITGPLVTTVHTVTDSAVKERIVRLYECGDNKAKSGKCHQAFGIEVAHVVDLTEGNTEIVTRFSTDIANSGRFYTDSNGLEMRDRDYSSSLPIQGNYYPVTTAAYIESQSPKGQPARLTVLTHQAHGATSLNNGELEIMLDRRLNQDDGRGLGESVTDNILTVIPLWIVVEPTPASAYNQFAQPALSFVASQVWHTRNYPVHSMYTSVAQTKDLRDRWKDSYRLSVSPLPSFPDRLQLLTLAPRDLVSQENILRVYYPSIATESDAKKSALLSFNPATLFNGLSIENSKEMSLSLLYEKATSTRTKEFTVRPTEITTLVVQLAPTEERSSAELEIHNPQGHDDTAENERDDVENQRDDTVENEHRPDDDEKPFNENDDGLNDLDNGNGKENDNGNANQPDEEEPIAVDETKLIVPIEKEPAPVEQDRAQEREQDREQNGARDGGQDRGRDRGQDRGRDRGRDRGQNRGQDGRGKTAGGVSEKKKDPSPSSNNTTGLYAMSIVFYLGLLVVVVLGGWVLGRRRSHKDKDEDKRSAGSRIPAVWKEREDSMMKLL